jgi:hypothetical protein
MSEIEKYKKYLNFKANPRYLTRDFIVPLYTGTEPDILDDSNTQRESSVYKEFPNDMPIVSPKEIQNQPYKQLELADGGRVGFELGGSVQDWVKNTYPEVNFDFKKYPNIGVGTSNENYNMVKKAINKKLENPNYFKPSLDKSINNIADAFLKSYAKDDVSYLTSKSEFNKNGMLSDGDVSFFNYKSKGPTFVQDIVDKTGLKAEDVLDLIDERENFIELDIRPTIAGKTKQGATEKTNEIINQGEDWLIKNSKNYDNVENLKTGFKRVFGKDHPFLRQTLRTSYGMPKLNPLFYEGKQKSYQTHGAPAFTYGKPEMENLFRASLYNFSPTVRDKVLNELNDIIPKTKVTDPQKYNLRKKFENSKILSELGINKRLSGPVTRLLIKDLGENIVEDINFVKTPRLQVGAYINFLKDKVDPKYKKQFELVNKAIRQLNYKNYNGAKDTLGIVENINLDHRVPKYLIDAGYADEIEYIKLNPIGENFNMVAKNKNFDQPIARLSRQYEAATTVEEKTKIIQEMNELKDSFNKRYNNYLSDINIKEVGGKLNVSSSLKPITSADEFIKTLETNVKQNPELFKILNKIENVKTKSAIDIADELSKEDARAVCGKLNLGGLPKGCAELAGEDPEKFLKTVAETTKDTSLATKANQAFNFTKKIVSAADEVILLGKGVAGRTVAPLAILNSALEQFTAGNYREAYRQAFDFLDPLPLVGINVLEKYRQEGSIENVKSRIKNENQESFNRLLEFNDVYNKLEDVNTRLERAEYATQDPNAAPESYDPNYINDLKKQQKDLNKIVNSSRYQNISNYYSNVVKDVIEETSLRNKGKPKQEEYAYETATQETFNRFINPNLLKELNEQNKGLYKNTTASAKIFEDQSKIPMSDAQRTVIESMGEFYSPPEQIEVLPQQKTEIPFVEEQKELPDEYMVSAAEGGRIGLSGGGGPKMGRRGFLGLIAGAAAAPDLIKAIKGTGQAGKIASKIKFEKTEGMYPWFPDLVEKIKTKGKPFEEKEIIMEASYKHEPKGYGGLPKGEETVTRHVDGDTEFLLREYPDGRIAVDIHSPRNQEGSSTPVTLYYRPTMELKYYSGVKVEPAEFKVLEKEPRYFANGPDDVDIEMSETRKIPGKNTIYGDVEAAERFATGKIENRKIIPAKQARREQMEDAPTDFIEETSPYGPVYD